MKNRIARALVLFAQLPLLVSSSLAESNLTGTYLVVQEATSVTKLPVVNDIVATVRTVGLVSLSHQGPRLRGEGKICELSLLSSSKLVKTSFPKAFRRALPPLRIDAFLSRDSRGIRFRQKKKLVVLGAHLKNKSRDSLPDEASDVRVFDHDKDGHPGVTVSVSGLVKGQIYLVQRSSSRLEGRRHADGFRGKVFFENEQKILGASNPLLRRDPGARPDPERSHFQLRRVSADYDCSDALKKARQH